ncbi:MAG: DNA primase [Acidimicrobiales bacterium]|nr:MAG: DNA primase [Acidimicrobiales bacterium]
MLIGEEDVANVRAATDLVALVGEHLALKRQGRRWVGLCPFHAETTPSFGVNPELGFYYCFGCQASGDAISFLRAIEHLDFVDAVERLAGRAGISIAREEASSGRQGGGSRQRARLLEAMESAVAWYHERLLRHPDAAPARDYLQSRGFGEEEVRAFRLGWAPDDWDALGRSLKLPEDILSGAGLGFVNRLGRIQDAFRGRVIFPIFDPGGRAVALGGRILPGAGGAAGGRAAEPKYKNSAETAIYSKRRILYGLNWAKANVVETGEVIVCEGYTDVMAFFGAGAPRAVATCGTALGEDHLRVLKSFAKRVVLAYDADSAGQAAAERVYEWERRHEVDIAVVALPGGSDPAELGRRDPQALLAAVSAARPYLEFRVDRMLSLAALDTVEGRVKAAEAALAVVVEHPNEMVRDQYLMTVAGHCRVPPGQLRTIMARGIAGGATSQSFGPGRWSRRRDPDDGQMADDGRSSARDGRGSARDGRASQDGGHGSENGRGPAAVPAARLAPGPGTEALRLAVHRPHEVADLLGEFLFADDLQQRAFRALASSATLHQAISDADPEVASLLRRLALEDTEADASDVINLLLGDAVRRALEALEADARRSDESFAQLARDATWLRQALSELREAPVGSAAAPRLVAWLRDRVKEQS